ncbi:efflux RND transporter periplasmic adaptor subunit [Jiella avicenniae]|uniref:Efflux RND transporter periplasmic adaptor subunit n=1 Tax=Jiella avicenniae TaxID=2907202 RepID=A0A9X1P1N7_9HYPH|nr:efflux RND transporter periplasmic adaptor subunit [Jiella avicenniae]MCE7029782.1 efflux RND transporter periplasmic adaptor subunit [Jiella avicenniae]
MRRFPRLGALAVVPLLAGCGDEAVPEAPPQVAAFVEAEVEPFSRTISLTGTIVARNTSTYAFETGGRVTEVDVDVGDHVEVGTVLARIDPTQEEADVASAKAKVGSAEAVVAQAEAAFERQTKLLAQGFTTRSDYDDAEQTLARARSDLDTARSDLTTAENTLDDTVLKAKADGVITSRSIDPGQVVTAAQAAFGFAQSGALDAVFRVQEQLLLAGGNPPSVEVSLVENPSVSAIGHIREVSPLIDGGTGTVQVKLGLENPPPAMTLGSAVVGRETSGGPSEAVSLPWNALLVKNGQPAVWVVGEGDKPVLKSVEIAAYRTKDILVASGIARGERVITAGSQLVLPGTTPQLVRAEREKTR